MNNSVFEDLKILNLTSNSTRRLYNNRTRDVESLNVWQDEVTGVIYIDDFYTGDESYVSSSYNSIVAKTNYEVAKDAERRFNMFLPLVSGKNIADFGCGSGAFLHLVKDHCGYVCGVELQQNCVENLNTSGIDCFSDMEQIVDGSLDVCVSFHVLEHLPEPIKILKKIKNKIRKGGHLIVEVPHANDFLLSIMPLESFKQFTLWSPHLVLHNRLSITRLLQHVGFGDIQIEGVQRYPLSNHLGWLYCGKPGGHKSPLSRIDSPVLTEAYQNSLAKLDATDTLVVIARNEQV